MSKGFKEVWDNLGRACSGQRECQVRALRGQPYWVFQKQQAPLRPERGEGRRGEVRVTEATLGRALQASGSPLQLHEVTPRFLEEGLSFRRSNLNIPNEEGMDIFEAVDTKHIW